jgi:hypothetical protein
VTWVSKSAPENVSESDLENEFQFQYQGYAGSAGGVNPLRHKRA